MASIFEILIVAGGGSGGQHTTTNANGGGGGGGVVYFSTADLNSSTNYTVSVGAGGAAVNSNANGNRGTNSYIGSYVAIGGGGGGGSGQSFSAANLNGGSGGGYSYPNGGGNNNYGISIQDAVPGATVYGNRGAIGASTWTGGGGGGAGTVGVDGTSSAPGGNGGQGVPFTITGTQKYYAGGGGGGGNSSERAGDGYHGGGRGAGTTSYYSYATYTNEVNATTLGSGTPNAIVNTGGGGGGGSYWAPNGGWSSGSGAGGSGVIVIKYPDTYGAATVTGSPTVTNPTGYRVYQFTSSGTFQPPYTGPANTVLPAITGSLNVGQTLSVDTGTWSAPGTITYSYQWKRETVAISGATSNTYTLTEADGDKYITCTVNATESGLAGTATSARVFVVAPNSRYMEYLLVAGGGGGGTKIGGGGGGGGLLHANALAPDDGDAEFTTPGTYSWVCPAGVTSVSVVCVGGGGGGGYQWSSGGGGGGGLGWKNAIAVTPGTAYTVVVGAGGPSLANAANAGSEGGNSYFIGLDTVAGYGGGRGGPNSTATANGRGGGYFGDGGGRGGDGAYEGSWTRAGAGAGGYSGRGGEGAVSGGSFPETGSGAGAGGGHYSSTYGVPAGGGVGLYGRGADGVARGQYLGGGGGSGGGNGTGGEGSGESSYKGITGGQYGGGGGGSGTSYGGGAGGGGAVRIIWGGGRSFPTNAPQSTNTIVSPPLVQKGLYTVTVGAGGAGASAGTTNAGAQGGNSSFAGLVAIGGGGGGSRNDANTSPATTGGSGGGANGYTGAQGASGTSGQGRKGGNSAGTGFSGGGGGAGAAGGSGTLGNSQAGGDGIADTILTTSYYWGGGGGGSGYSVTGGNGGLGGGGGGAIGTTLGGGSAVNSGSAGGGGAINTSANTAGGSGGAGTGGGGGGGSLGTATNAGGNGGGGAVILRYPDTKNAALYATNLDAGYPVVTGGYRIYKWSSSGTIQFGATGGPALVVAPTITVTSGSVTNGLAGAVLTCGTGTWQGDATIVYTYQWYSNGVIKAGQTASTYTTLLSDAFKTLTCKVTATNSADTLTVDTSNGMNVLINGFVSVRNDYGFGINQAVTITDSSQTTLAESTDFTITNTITDGNEKLTRQEVVISTTYSASDNTPVTQGTGTGTAGPTQSWYIG